MGGESCTVLRLRLMRKLAMSLKNILQFTFIYFCKFLDHKGKTSLLKKLRPTSGHKQTIFYKIFHGQEPHGAGQCGQHVRHQGPVSIKKDPG